MNDDFHAGRLEEVAVVDGYCVEVAHDENVWIETWDGRLFTVDSNGRKSLTTPPSEGKVLAIFDEGFIEKTGDVLRLFDTSAKEVTAISVPPVPRSSYASGFPQYEGGWLDTGAKDYWYAGYGTTGEALLYLIDPLSLSILDSIVPKAFHWDGVLTPWTAWGDDPRWVAGEGWVAMTSNTGDSFDYFSRYRASSDTIEPLHDKNLEMSVRCASDAVVPYVAALTNTLVACDDLGWLCSIDLQSGAAVKKRVTPFAAWLDGDAIRVPRYTETPDRRDFLLMEIESSGDHVFVDAQIDPYGTGPSGDFPLALFFMLDQELKTVAAFDPHEADPDADWSLQQKGLVASMKDGKTTLFRWTP